MKRLLPLFFLCLLLCSCASGAAVSPIEDAAGFSGEQAESPVLKYLPESNTEKATGGAVLVYPLSIPDASGIRCLGNRVLLFSGAETTTLTMLEGDSLQSTATLPLDFLLRAEDPSLQMGKDTFSYYDPIARETVVMSSRLKVIRRIAAPEYLSGSPLLSNDGTTLYYCTADAVRLWDLESGIRRTLKQMSLPGQSLTGLHMDETVLQCTVAEDERTEQLFLSCENGQLLHRMDGPVTLSDQGGQYCAVIPTGCVSSVVFGQDRQIPSAITGTTSQVRFAPLEILHAAAGISPVSAWEIRLDLYSLSDGKCLSRLRLPCRDYPVSIDGSSDRFVYLLAPCLEYGGSTIFRWDPDALPSGDETFFSEPWYTRENPDLEGLAHCRELAGEIGERHGIQIKIWDDAAAVQPWDYQLESEYLTGVLESELHLLDQRLEAYPNEMLAQTASHFGSLNICLVRQISGSPESGSLETVTGVQFLDGKDAYVVIAVGEHSRQALYHELYHVMETRLFTHSIALDRWDQLNPRGFSYDYSYWANASRDSGVYLSQENRAFIDTYSMSYPKEDRARILEYAMLPGNEALFTSPILQAKLSVLCQGIREAYGLEEESKPLLWEQYLK